MICCGRERGGMLSCRQAVRLPADFGERKKKKIPQCHLLPERGWCGAWGSLWLGQPDPASESETAAPWVILGSRSAPRRPSLRGISRHSVTLELFAHQPKTASSFPGPGWVPVQPTIIVLLPALAATMPTGVRFLGTEERGRRGRWALQPPFSDSFVGISASTRQPTVPVLSHRSALLQSLPRDAPTHLIPRVGGWVGSRQEMTTSKGPGKILGLSGKDLKTAWKGWGG